MSSHNTLGTARYVVLGAITALGFSVAAHAGEVTGDTATELAGKSTVIQYSDLNLSQDADVRTLYSRLQRASQRVCNQNRDGRDLRSKRLYDACYQDTLARAVDSVGHEAVKAMYAKEDRIRVAGRGDKALSRT